MAADKKTLPLRLSLDEYQKLTFDHIAYMAETGQRVTLTAYIKIMLDLLEPANENINKPD
ncbi:hypothetical protein [Nostoc sp. FACHB-110]|uniref:hypothetical protein n=1 Tax=Nostoc sp. FACHB-110 TaxID=2692834 RepID=UPI001682A8A5|nr:hypothetical protein [Nostoc sp. FACHB-110]MBD2435448.1 hypothetical protein [Nostoc sp. FACHB-110]